jgi:His Kinase A (phospho-acceptor) domain/Transcriptional regulatory protein, C terminal
VANASHELRTPLAMMRTSLDVSTGKPGPVPSQVTALGDKVREGLDQADRLLESFLTRARAEREHGRPDGRARGRDRGRRGRGATGRDRVRAHRGSRRRRGRFTKTVQVTIARLRRKLGDPAVIETLPGIGYRIAA